VVRLIIGDGSSFGDPESLIGGHQRTLITELIDPNSKYDKNQCAAACEILHVLFAKLKELADDYQS